MKKLVKIAVGTAIFIFVVFAVVTSYFAITYIDDSVTRGTAFGFRIGSTKSEAFSAARGGLSNNNVYIYHPIESSGVGPRMNLDFDDTDYNILLRRDKWELYFDSSFFDDVLKLEFRDGKLVLIQRQRQWMELP